jgi:hypothetical protein
MATGDEILGWIKETRKQQPYKMADCPICGWPLEEGRGVLHCPFDGWTSGIPDRKTKDDL